jgi:hypothetical protein
VPLAAHCAAAGAAAPLAWLSGAIASGLVDLSHLTAPALSQAAAVAVRLEVLPRGQGGRGGGAAGGSAEPVSAPGAPGQGGARAADLQLLIARTCPPGWPLLDGWVLGEAAEGRASRRVVHVLGLHGTQQQPASQRQHAPGAGARDGVAGGSDPTPQDSPAPAALPAACSAARWAGRALLAGWVTLLGWGARALLLR